jgi:hypothetical protein
MPGKELAQVDVLGLGPLALLVTFQQVVVA